MSLVSFLGVDTGSPGKLHTIQQQIQLINGKFPLGFNGYCLGLPGTGAQCNRHVDEYSKYGIQPNKQIFVDCEYKVHRAQVRWKENENSSVSLIHGDIQAALNESWKEGKQIDIIDYDGTSFFNPSHEQVLRAANLHDVKVVITVMTTRAPHLTQYHRDWKQRLGLKMHFPCPSKGWREPMKDIAKKGIAHVAEECGFDHTFIAYAGRSGGAPPMLSGVFTNKKFIR